MFVLIALGLGLVIGFAIFGPGILVALFFLLLLIGSGRSESDAPARDTDEPNEVDELENPNFHMNPHCQHEFLDFPSGMGLCRVCGQ